MANPIRDLARTIFGINLPGAAVQPNKRDITDQIFALIDTLIGNLQGSVGGLAPIPTSTAMLPDSTNRRYLTDAQLALLASGNFSAGSIYTTLANLTADAAPALNARAEVINDSTPANNGTYRKSAAAGTAGWTKESSSGIYATLARFVADEALIAANDTAIRQKTAALYASLTGGAYAQARVANHGSVAGTFDDGGGTRKQWMATAIMADGDRIDAMRVSLANNLGTGTTIEALLYVQPASAPSSAVLTDLTGYTLVDTFTADLALYLTGATAQTVTLPVAASPYLAKGTRIAYVVRLRDSGNAMVAFSFGQAKHFVTTEEPYAQGGLSTTTTLTSFSAPSTGNKIWCEPIAKRAAARPSEQGSETAKRGVKLVPVEANVRTVLPGQDFTRVAFAVRPTAGLSAPGAFAFYGDIMTTVVYWRLRVYVRPFRDGSYGSSPFTLGSGANDRLIYARDYAAADVMDISATINGQMQRVQLDTLGMPGYSPDEIALYEVTPYLVDRITRTTFRPYQALDFGNNITLMRGAFTTSTTAETLTNASVPFAFEVMEAVRSENGSPDGATPVIDQAQTLESVTEFQTGTASFAFPRVAISSAGRRTVIPAQTVNVTSVAGTTYALTDTITMRYAQADAMTALFWSGTPVVTRVSDSVVLVAGTDYVLDNGRGTITGVKNVADTPVSISYNAYKMRCDLLMAAAWTQELQIVEGTPQFSDPENWKRSLVDAGSNGRIDVGEVLVKPTGIEVLNRTGFVFGSKVARGLETEIRNLKEWNAQYLVAPRLALQRGQNITVITYGDSITGCGGGTEPAYQTAPGGPSRDTVGYLTKQTAAASLAQMGTPATTGPAGANSNWYGSFGRRMAAAIANRYGVTIDFKNLGIGGTDTGSGGAGTEASRYGGSNATRLAGILAAKGSSGLTLCLIAFGTNEADDETMINNLTTIARYCLANGIIPILVGQPALAYGTVRAISRQQRNDERILRAARTAPCAVVPLSYLTHERRGASGIFRTLQSGAGRVNHPGIYEHKVYGEWIDELCFR